MLSPDMLSLLLISLPIGFVGSLTGLGGASILVPLLVFMGIPVKEAIASGMVAIIATSSGSASSYVQERIASVRIAMYLEMFTIIGALLGATLTTFLEPVYLYFFFAAFLSTSFLKIRGAKKNNDLLGRNHDKVARFLDLQGNYFDEAARKIIPYRAEHALWGGMGMLVAGIAAGMLGIGAGAFKVTVQENILKLPEKVASATSNFIIGMTALAGTSVYFFSGLINITLTGPILIGITIGALAGGRILNKLETRKLQILFWAVVILLIVQMLYKGVRSI
jgi:uncharacterized protein